MATFAIDGVRINPTTDRVTHVRWGLIDLGTHDWLAPPEIVELDTVIQSMRSGNVVWSLFTLGGRRFIGPKIKAVSHTTGHDGIDTDVPNGSIEKCMDDLPRV